MDMSFRTTLSLLLFLGLVSGETLKQKLFNLVNRIVDEYFQAYRCLTVLVDDEDKANVLKTQIPVFLVNTAGRKHGISEDWLLTSSYEEGCGGYVIFANAHNRWTLVRDLVEARRRANGHRYNNQRYLFVPENEEDSDWAVLNHPDMFFFPNVLAIAPNGSEFSLLGNTIFDGYERNLLREFTEILDVWSPEGGFAHNRNLFPDRIRNIKGKKLIFGVTHYVPYSLVLQEGNQTVYDGLETRIAALFVDKINGTWNGLDHPIHLWGTKFPNGSGTGIYGSVQKHAADFGYSAIYQWYCDTLDCSYPYIQPEVTCLVPRPQVLSGWLTVVLPFSTSTWIAFYAAYCISSVFVFGVTLARNRYRGVSTGHILPTAFHSFYTIYRIQLQQIPKNVYRSDPISTYLKVSMVYYFLIISFWHGGIASILTVPRYEKPINTVTDLVSRWPKVKWGAIHDVWIHSIENSTERNLIEIVNKFLILDRENLMKKTRSRDFGFFIEKLPNGHYGFNDYINRETVPYLRLMEKSIYTAFGVIILPKGSPYTEKLNDFIHRATASGVIQKLEIQVSVEQIDNKLQNMIRLSNEKESGKVILGFRHIEGPIYIYFCGIFISLVALVLENVFFRFKEKQNNKIFTIRKKIYNSF